MAAAKQGLGTTLHEQVKYSQSPEQPAGFHYKGENNGNF